MTPQHPGLSMDAAAAAPGQPGSHRIAAPGDTLRLPGLDAGVEIYRDAWGIPHVRARTVHDAFFAQGLVHAEDRLWQMDSARRRMQGRWAEWVGPAGVAADALARRLGAHTAGERDYRALQPASQAVLQAYAAGVNAYLALGRPLSPEYALVGGAPEPWMPWHSIDAMRQRGWLMGSLWFKLWRAAALQHVAPDQISKLRYDDGGSDQLCFPPGAAGQRWIASLSELAPAIAAVAELAAGDATGGGSNNWAVAPGRTASGRPLLAGDPHRQFEMPGMYAQTHLACDAFDAIGFTVPGVPGFPHFAHNGQVAWCVTHAFADIHDLYVERFQGSGDALVCAFQAEWEATTRRTETVHVRGAADVQVEVVSTRHGPVVAGTPEAGSGLVLRSVQVVDTDLSFDCLLPMLQARSVDSLFDACRSWGLIDHNLLAADTQGHIGHLVRGQVPRRGRLNGWLPVPGWTGEHEWQGMLPAQAMPRTLDPARGFLVTANNRFIADERPLEGGADLANDAPYFLTDCHPPYRAQRIEALLAQLPAATPDDMARIHRDVRSLTAPVFQQALAGLTAADPACEALRRSIVDWDAQMQADSVGAAAYSTFRWQLAQVLAEASGLAGAETNPLIRLPPGTLPETQLWWTLPQLLRANDVGLLGGLNWAQACQQALSRAAAAFDGRGWGEQHHAKLQHPLQGLSPEADRQLALPGLPVPGDNDTVMANGCLPSLGLQAAYGAIARYVFDVGDWDNCRWIVLDGVCGWPGDAHRLDQHALWARGELVPMHYNWAAIAGIADPVSLQPMTQEPI